MLPIAIAAASRWLRGGGWKLVAGAMTALAIAGTIYWLSHSLSEARGELADANRTIATKEADNALLRRTRAADSHAEQVRTIYRDRVTKEYIERKEKTDEALRANPVWATTPVPPAVADSLR